MTEQATPILELIASVIHSVNESEISPIQADKAIYIDFEGLMNEPPSLIGVMIDGEFSQHVFDPKLYLAAAHSNLDCCDASSFCNELVMRASDEKRRIVAFSSYEKTIFKKYYGLDISPLYADARKIAKVLRPLILQASGEKPRDLKSYLNAIGYERGNYLGLKQTAPRIRAVSSMLEKRQDFENLTPTVKAKWTKVLQHNHIDVDGMSILVNLCSQATKSKKSNDKRIRCFTVLSNISSQE